MDQLSSKTDLPSTSSAGPVVTNDAAKANDENQENSSRSANNKPTEDLSTLFNRQRESILDSGNKGAAAGLRMGGSLGFGFRGTIPKLPSFKIKVSLGLIHFERDIFLGAL